MLRMCVYMHSCFIENHPIQILEDGSLIFEVVLSHKLRCKEIGVGLKSCKEIRVELYK
jgi:hypothetical protein